MAANMASALYSLQFAMCHLIADLLEHILQNEATTQISLVDGADEAGHEHRHDCDEDGEEGDALGPEVAHRPAARSNYID